MLQAASHRINIVVMEVEFYKKDVRLETATKKEKKKLSTVQWMISSTLWFNIWKIIFINRNTYKSEENRGIYDNLLLREVITGTFQIQNMVLILTMVREKNRLEGGNNVLGQDKSL